MALLHTISSSRVDLDLGLIDSQDVILFWQDGVILALESSPLIEPLVNLSAQLYALDLDIEARGLTPMVSSQVTIISLEQVVELTERFSPQMDWR